MGNNKICHTWNELVKGPSKKERGTDRRLSAALPHWVIRKLCLVRYLACKWLKVALPSPSRPKWQWQLKTALGLSCSQPDTKKAITTTACSRQRSDNEPDKQTQTREGRGGNRVRDIWLQKSKVNPKKSAGNKCYAQLAAVCLAKSARGQAKTRHETCNICSRPLVNFPTTAQTWDETVQVIADETEAISLGKGEGFQLRA